MKKVDLSILAESGIDCEFFNDEDDDNHYRDINVGRIGYISKDREYPFLKNVCDIYKHAIPRMNHWNFWQGGECPLPEGLMIELIFRHGYKLNNNNDYSEIIWNHHGPIHSDRDIIAFKVLGLSDGYCWPWEEE